VHKFISHTTQLKPARKEYVKFVYHFLPNDAKIYTVVDKALFYGNLSFKIPKRSQPEYQINNKNNFIEVKYLNIQYI